MEERKIKADDELLALKIENSRILEQVQELEKWTFKGIMIRLLRGLFGLLDNCVGTPTTEQAALTTPGPSSTSEAPAEQVSSGVS